MIDFQLVAAKSPAEAVQLGSKAQTVQQGAEVRFVAGGTTLIDLMKLDVETPSKVVDINRLELSKVDKRADGGLRIGALVRNSDLAIHPLVLQNYAVLSQALLSGASPQLRNMATTSGNILQRTRCMYFRDLTYSECNKRAPGSGCAAIGGHNRIHAILGTSDHCIATHPSDMAVAIAALDARVHVVGTGGERDININDFYLLPGSTPHLENQLKPGDLITYIDLPAPAAGTRSVYLKLRDRLSYEFALSSTAAIIGLQAGKISHARLALGGVGTKPWRAEEAEKSLEGKVPSEEHFRAAAEVALRGARPQTDNAFKVELAKRCVVRALKMASANA